MWWREAVPAPRSESTSSASVELATNQGRVCHGRALNRTSSERDLQYEASEFRKFDFMEKPGIFCQRRMDRLLKILILTNKPEASLLVDQELRKVQFAFMSVRVSTRESYEKLLRSFSPDMIFSDFYLDDFNALDALQLLRELQKEIPFVVVTDEDSPSVMQRCLKAGVDDYILHRDIFRLTPIAASLLSRNLEISRVS